MKHALLLACLAACYSPSYKDCEVMCASGTCPADLTCDQGVCRAPGFSGACGQMNGDTMIADVAPDGDMSLDTDMDGKNDAIDNCRTIPNSDQANEDGDTLGDVCDPCPPLKTYIEGTQTLDANLDGDNDGVGDGCDPNKNIFGDRIVLFDGFNVQMPATAVGPSPPTFANGHATIVAPNANQWGAVGFPTMVDLTKSQYVTTGFHINQVFQTSMVDGGGALAFFDGASRGAACLRGVDTTNAPLLSLAEVNSSSPITIDVIPAMPPLDVIVRARHRAGGSNFECNLVPSGGTATGGVGVPIQPQTRVGIYARSADIQFHWVMFVEGA